MNFGTFFTALHHQTNLSCPEQLSECPQCLGRAGDPHLANLVFCKRWQQWFLSQNGSSEIAWAAGWCWGAAEHFWNQGLWWPVAAGCWGRVNKSWMGSFPGSLRVSPAPPESWSRAGILRDRQERFRVRTGCKWALPAPEPYLELPAQSGAFSG